MVFEFIDILISGESKWREKNIIMCDRYKNEEETLILVRIIKVKL